MSNTVIHKGSNDYEDQLEYLGWNARDRICLMYALWEKHLFRKISVLHEGNIWNVILVVGRLKKIKQQWRAIKIFRYIAEQVQNSKLWIASTMNECIVMLSAFCHLEN